MFLGVSILTARNEDQQSTPMRPNDFNGTRNSSMIMASLLNQSRRISILPLEPPQTNHSVQVGGSVMYQRLLKATEKFEASVGVNETNKHYKMDKDEMLAYANELDNLSKKVETLRKEYYETKHYIYQRFSIWDKNGADEFIKNF